MSRSTAPSPASSRETTSHKTTKVLKCNCAHSFQDSLYGPYQRLHNWAIKQDQWRCSVCGSLHSDGIQKEKRGSL